MKKLIILIIVIAFLVYPLAVQATNTHSLDFELSDSEHATALDSAELSITGDITLEMWVKLEQTAGTAGSVFYILSKAKVQNGNYSYWFYIHSTDDKLHLGISDDGSADAGHLTIAGSVTAMTTTGTWIHLATKFDASLASISFWFDGVEEAPSEYDLQAATSIADTDAKFCISCLHDGSGNPSLFFDGKIDDVRIWNDLRTESEIQDNFNTDLIGNEGGLVGYWMLNNDGEDKGIVTDPTGSNADDLTLVSSDSGPTYSVDVPFVGQSPPAVEVEDEFPVMQLK